MSTLKDEMSNIVGGFINLFRPEGLKHKLPEDGYKSIELTQREIDLIEMSLRTELAAIENSIDDAMLPPSFRRKESGIATEIGQLIMSFQQLQDQQVR